MRGNPQRTATFARRKIFLVSTPTIQGLSQIERQYEASDQRHFYVPCPYCGELQTLIWPQIQFDDVNGAYYSCLHCHKRIDEFHKTDMLKHGEWRATYPDRPVAGFHLSSLYSPVGWFSWQHAVDNFRQAQTASSRANGESLLKVWVNTTLGEPWVDRGECPEWERLFERAEDYPRGTVPAGACVLTAGVDVQKDRLECEIVGWGPQKESWSIDHIVIPESPTSPKAWKRLTEVLEKIYPFENSDYGLNISMMAVDTGYSTQEVYNWVRQQNPYKVIAVKGVDKVLIPLGAPTRVDVTVGGRKLSRGVKLWPVGVSLLKSELYAWLKLTRSEEGECPPGYAHFPKYSPEFFKQLTAEQLVTKMVKGAAKREWQKLRERNEALDCRVYARAATLALGMDRWSESQWAKLQAQHHVTAKEDVPETGEKEPQEILQSSSELQNHEFVRPSRPVAPRNRTVRCAWMTR